jgi:Cu2+-exporting ATPase/Cu+-exporting ATPase
VSDEFAYLDDPELLRGYAREGAAGREMRLYLEGVHCAACVWLTERLPAFDAGVRAVRLDLGTGVATLALREGGSFAHAARELARFGYRAHPVRAAEAEALQTRENRRMLARMAVAAAGAGNLMLLAVALYAGADGALAAAFRWVSFALFLPVLLFSAAPFFSSAVAALRARSVSIDVPIALGISIGTGASLAALLTGSPDIYFDSLGSLIFLMLSTRYLMKRVHQRALSTGSLMHFMAPSRASRLVADGAIESVPTDALRAGDLIRVLPNECFPVDGVVLSGAGAVHCALLTGESRPARIAEGGEVHAGTQNLSTPLEIRVTASGAETRLGRILREMEGGLARKAPIVSLLDRVGRGFVAAVLILAAFGFAVGATTSWHEAVSRALAVAIIVCPCTFALATPLAMSLAVARCARRGVLIKDGEVLERLSRVREAWFDKTGTLTAGTLEVLDAEFTEAGLEDVLAALEAASSHPVARAIQRWRPAPAALAAAGIREIAGRGVQGRVNGVLYEVRGAAEGSGSQESATVVELMRSGERVGRVSLGDRVRHDSAEAVSRLKALGIEPRLVSGDGDAPARAVARATGIGPDAVLARVTPEGKGRLLADAPRALMVGDGANDAIALAAAYVGFAVQGGMEISLRAAGAYSTRPGVMPVAETVVIARETMRVIRRNLALAVVYNGVGIAFALGGALNPLVAAVLMPINAFTLFLSTVAGTRELRRLR